MRVEVNFDEAVDALAQDVTVRHIPSPKKE